MKNPFARWPKWLKRTLLVIACLPIALPVLALSALAVPFTRRPIVRLALDLTNDALDGMRIELDSADRLDLWGIDLTGARLFDEKKRELVSVRKVSVRIAPWSLVSGTLQLKSGVVAGGRVHLYPSDEPDEPEEPEEESEPSTFQIFADSLRVTDTTLDMDVSGRALHAVLRELEAVGGYGPKTRASIRRLDVHADLNGQRAASLRSTYGSWDQARGGKLTLAGELLDARVRIAAEVPRIDAKTPWPVKRADVSILGLSNAGLAKVGFAEAAQLRVPADLHVYAETEGQKADTLVAKLELDAGRAHLRVRGKATPSLYAVELGLPPVDLASVSGILPSLRIGVGLSAELSHAQKPMAFELALRDLQLDGRAVPNTLLRGNLALPTVQLDSLVFAGLEQALSLSGRYDTSSDAAEVELDTNELDLARLGGLVPAETRGTFNGGLRAALTGQRLSGHSDLSLRYFRMEKNRIDNARFSLDLSGTLKEPRGELKLGAYQVAIDQTKLKRIEFNALAKTQELVGDLSVEGVDRFLMLGIEGTRSDDGSVAIDAHGTGRIKDKQLGLKLRQLKAGGGDYSVQELTAFSGRERVYVSGALTGGETVDASVQVANVNLARWTRLFLEDEISGMLDLTAKIGGKLEQPMAEASLGLRGLHSQRTPRAPVVDLATKLKLDTSKHQASIWLDAHSQDRRVELSLSAEASLARSKQLAQAFSRARLKLDLKGHTDVPFLSQFAEAQLGPLEGSVSADLSIDGSMDEAAMYAKFASTLVPRAERDKSAPDRVDLDIVLKPELLNVDLIVQDKFGKAIDLTSQATLPKGGPNELIRQGSALMHAPVAVKLLVNERRLDKLQGSLGMLAQTYGATLPVRVKAQVDLASTGQAITGSVSARAHVWGEGLDDACGEDAEGDVTVAANLAGDKLRVDLTAEPKGGGEAKIALESQLLVNSVLDGSAFGWGPATLSARGSALALHTLPGLCMLPESRTGFKLDAKNLGRIPLQTWLDLDVDGVATRDGPPMGGHLSARSEPNALIAKADLKLGGTVKGQLSARVPLLYGDSPVPQIPLDQPVTADLNLPDFPLDALTAFTDVVGRAGGRVKAKLHVGGTLKLPDPSGSIELKDASFSIAALAQPFSDVDARFELSPDKLIIHKLNARDRGGKIGLVGYARYNPTRGGEAELHLSADKFPMRQQGSIIGELSTRAVLEGKIDANQKLSLTLDLKEGRIYLTGEGGRTVQELDEHPDIRFDAQRAVLADTQPAADDGISLALLRIRSQRDFWLMHDDFTIQVGVDMKLTTDADGATLQGEATITRGDLNLLGKPFRIEKGVVRFTGDVPPDPELDLKAKHTTRQGQTLIVQIQGRGSAPQIIFSGAATNAGEAAMLLSGIGASGAESKAKGDAASFAAGLTAGLLAVSARRRFGDWVPMLAIENNAQGAPSGARAGFDASRLIPKFMEGFARGMFVEGVVGSRSDTGNRGVGVGVRVEVALPSDFMTSMGYGPGTVWSTDVYWSP